MKHLFTLSAILLFVLVFAGCRRDRLVFPHPDTALVELKIDWSRSAFDANSATAVLYRDGAYFRSEVFSVHPPVRTLVELPAGTYDMILHNDQVSDFESTLQFVNRPLFSNYEVRPMDDTRAGRAPTRGYKLGVDTLVVDRHVDMVITPEMVDYSYLDPSSSNPGKPGGRRIAHSHTFSPARVFTEVLVRVNVTYGNGYYFTSANPAALKGLSGGYAMGADSYSSDPVWHVLGMGVDLRSAGAPVVRFSAQLLAVGLAQGVDASGKIIGDYTLSLPFTYNGGLVQHDIALNGFDPENRIKTFKFTPEDPTNPLSNSDRLEIEVNLTLSELVPVGNSDVGVEDWDDVDIPLDGPQKLHFVANDGSGKAWWWAKRTGDVINMPTAESFLPNSKGPFKHWNTQADGNGQSYQIGDTYEMQRGGAIFYAIWE